jgi:hypothetical protein
MMAVKPGLDLLDTLDIHDRGAMYPEELSGVELLPNASEGLAEFVVFVDPNVFQLPAPFTLGDAPRTIGSVRTVVVQRGSVDRQAVRRARRDER